MRHGTRWTCLIVLVSLASSLSAAETAPTKVTVLAREAVLPITAIVQGDDLLVTVDEVPAITGFESSRKVCALARCALPCRPTSLGSASVRAGSGST